MNNSNAGMIHTPMTEALSRYLDVDLARYKLVAGNLANVDTPGYRARDLDFRSELKRAAADENNLGEGFLQTVSFHPVARQVRGLMERPDGNNVSVERESLLLAETQMRFNLAVQLLKDHFHTISLAINSGSTTL
ncbi:MAG TPA: flagellar basal body rod protein FlgB [Terriglobales bacterium]|jgi:flagellar basal-body rod protein FlgB